MSLTPSMEKLSDSVDIWYIDLQQLQPAAGYWQLLDEREQAAANAFVHASLRSRYITVHALVRMILASYLADTDAKALCIDRNEFGKPFLSTCPALSFNLSHTGSWMLLAVSRDIKLGVDIEQIKPRGLLQGLVCKCFSPTEQRYWMDLPPSLQEEMFYAFWTRKEAFVKAVGRGIALGLSACEIDTQHMDRFKRLPAGCGAVTDWAIVELTLNPACKAALVLNGVKTGISVKTDIMSLLASYKC